MSDPLDAALGIEDADDLDEALGFAATRRDGRRVRTNLLDRSGVTAAEVKRRAAAGEVVDALRPDYTRGEAMGALGLDAVTGLGEGIAGLGGLVMDVATTLPRAYTAEARALGRGEGLGGAQAAGLREALALPASRKVTEVADKARAYVADRAGISDVDTGVPGAVARLVGNVIAPGPEIAAAGRRGGVAVRAVENLADDAARGADDVLRVADDLAPANGNAARLLSPETPTSPPDAEVAQLAERAGRAQEVARVEATPPAITAEDVRNQWVESELNSRGSGSQPGNVATDGIFGNGRGTPPSPVIETGISRVTRTREIARLEAARNAADAVEAPKIDTRLAELRREADAVEAHAKSAPRPDTWTRSGAEIGPQFHGGAEAVDQVDPSRLQANDSGWWGQGFYTSPVKDGKPLAYAGLEGAISEFRPHPDARVLEIQKVPTDNPAALQDEIADLMLAHEQAGGRFQWREAVRAYAEQNGYDAIYARGGDGDEVAWLRHDKIDSAGALPGGAGGEASGALVRRQPSAVVAMPSSANADTNAFDANAYVDMLTARREAARGLTASPASSLGSLVRQAKAKVVDAYAPIEDPLHAFAKTSGSDPKDVARALIGDGGEAFTLPGRPGVQPGTLSLSGETVPVLANGQLLPSRDITNAIDRSIMSDEIASQFLKDRGFDRVIRDAPRVEALEQYAAAKHAITLFYQRWGKFVDEHGQMRRVAYEPVGYRSMALQVEGRVSRAAAPWRSVDEGARPRRLQEIYRRRFGRDLVSDAQMVKALHVEYEPFAQQLGSYSRDLLDYSVDSGLVDPNLAGHLKAIYPYYVPLERVFSVLEKEADGAARPTGVASISRQTVLREFEGSAREIESPIESLIKKTYDATAQGERNKAARLLASYRNLEGNPLQIREVSHGERAASTFSYLDSGKKRRFATTPEIAAAAKALNVEQMSLLARILAVPARVLKVGATGLNLPFLVKNPVRDIPTAIINSEAGFGVAREVGRSIFEAVKHGDLYDRIVRDGGMFTSFDQFRLPNRETVPAIRSTRSAASRVRYVVRHPGELFRAVEDIVSRGEQATRIAVYQAEYKRALAVGLGEEEARISAKRASLWTTGPFHRQGEWGAVLRASAPYLNAGIQGVRVSLGAMKARPVQTFAKLTATTLFPVAAATAWNLSDPDRKRAYDQIADFEKEGSIILVPPEPTKDDNGLWNVIKIPLPQGVANLASLVRRPLEAAAELEPVRLLEIAKALLGTASPVSTPSEFASNVVPQAVKPALETLVNRNFYTRRDIVPFALRDEPVSEQVGRRTSGTARLLSKITGLAPLQIDHLARGYFAGVGSQVVNGVDRTLAALGVIPEEQIGGEGPIDMTLRGFGKAIPKAQPKPGPIRGGSGTGVKSGIGPTSSLDKYGHDSVIDTMRALAPQGSSPDVVAQIAGSQPLAYVAPDGERTLVPASLRSAFVGMVGSGADMSNSPLLRWVDAMVKQKKLPRDGTLTTGALADHGYHSATIENPDLVAVPPQRLLPPTFPVARHVTMGTPLDGTVEVDGETVRGAYGKPYGNKNERRSGLPNTVTTAKDSGARVLWHELGHAAWVNDVPDSIKSRYEMLHVAAAEEWTRRTSKADAMMRQAEALYDTDMPRARGLEEAAERVFSVNDYVCPPEVRAYLDDPAHSYADLFSTYIGAPSALKRSYPKFYELMRESFGGVEYIRK